MGLSKRNRRNLRRVHINNQEWKWYTNMGNVIIFSPDRKRYEVNQHSIAPAGEIQEGSWIAPDIYPLRIITPSRVKRYIMQSIL